MPYFENIKIKRRRVFTDFPEKLPFAENWVEISSDRTTPQAATEATEIELIDEEI